MRDCVSNRLRGIRPASRSTYRKLRLLAGLLLILGMLAGSGLLSLHAQPPRPAEGKQAVEPPKDLPPSVPTAQAQPTPPQMAGGPGPAGLPPMNAPQRSQFTIDPKTPLKDLLPLPPKIERRTEPIRGNDLGLIPEVKFEAPQGSRNAEAMKHIAHQIAKINHLNNTKTDGFLEALRNERPDLTGLPFAMGDACRTKGERSKQFAIAVALVRQAMQPPALRSTPVPPPPVAPTSGPAPTTTPAPAPGGGGPAPSTSNDQPGGVSGPRVEPGNAFMVTLSDVAVATTTATVDPPSPESFWDQYRTLCVQQDKTLAHSGREQCEQVIPTRIAALSQILMPMTQMHAGLAKYLATLSHVEATRALARMALFSAEDDARKTAIEALKVRRERDYTEVLVEGLSYPWPVVARRAAEAIVKLERNDLLPKLIDVLEKPDPRTPVTQEVKGKSVPVVREMVRVNHHQSCLLCHAPGNTGKVSGDAVTAEVPVPGQPLNPPSGGYSSSQPDIMVRVDVTYLRQDFSAMLAVADANPWPEMQRFDFLVRTRILNDEEATTYRDKLQPREPGAFSPYHRAALTALRELTGRDTEPTPQAWRRLLKLPAETQRKTS